MHAYMYVYTCGYIFFVSQGKGKNRPPYGRYGPAVIREPFMIAVMATGIVTAIFQYTV